MKGIVDDSGRAILPVEILCTKQPTGVQVDGSDAILERAGNPVLAVRCFEGSRSRNIG